VLTRLFLALLSHCILFNSRSSLIILKESKFFDHFFVLINLILQGSQPLSFAFEFGRVGQVFVLKVVIVVGT
jgi:hypothetical protein